MALLTKDTINHHYILIENIVDHVVANNIMTTHGMTYVTPKTTRCPFQQVLFDTII
jgi:type III secretory pathway component EscR